MALGLILCYFRSERDATAYDAVRVERETFLCQIIPWVCLTNVCGEGATILVFEITGELIREIVVPQGIFCQYWVIDKGCEVQWRP